MNNDELPERNSESLPLKDLPADWWAQQSTNFKLYELFSKHLLTLGVGYTLNKEPQYEWFSGFLLQIDKLLFWLTAGHVIDRIEKLSKHPDVKINSMQWLDGYEKQDAASVHFSPEHFVAYSDSQADFGAVIIRDLYARQILANPNIKPITPELWLNHEKSHPDGHYLLGVPREVCSLREVGKSQGKVHFCSESYTVSVPIEQVEYKSSQVDNPFWNDQDAFYGKVLDVLGPDGKPIQSIKGMSGGPIFSIERTPDDQLKYRLFGIQSKWLPDSRILKAESMVKVAKIIESWFAGLPES